MAAHPLRPLIKGMFFMGVIALLTLVFGWSYSEMQEQEAKRARLLAEQQRQLKEERERHQAEQEDRRRQIQEADRRAFAEREAAAAKRQAELSTRRRINVGQHLEALRKKAEDGDAEAQYQLGWITRFGTNALGGFNTDGTSRYLQYTVIYPLIGENLRGKTHEVLFVDLPDLKPDEAGALRWYRRAAAQGHDEAMRELGHHQSFAGPDHDVVEAYKWYLLSRASYYDPSGMVWSTRQLGPEGQIIRRPWPADARPYAPPGLIGILSAEQKAEAAKRAKAFQPKKEKP